MHPISLWHPDKHSSNPQVAQNFRQVANTRESVLGWLSRWAKVPEHFPGMLPLCCRGKRLEIHLKRSRLRSGQLAVALDAGCAPIFITWRNSSNSVRTAILLTKLAVWGTERIPRMGSWRQKRLSWRSCNEHADERTGNCFFNNRRPSNCRTR